MKNMETWRGIEDSSGLCSGTIHSVKFLKPVEFHHEGQQEAHLIIGFDSRIQANKVIQHGIIIKGKELHASKELPDALQCINCSDLPRNHNMKNCLNSTKCGQCAGGHTTKECTVTDQKKFHCVNCKTSGYGAADRNSCPSFIRATDTIRSWYPEAKYKYFVAEDPMIWVSNDVQNWTETEHPQKPLNKGIGRAMSSQNDTTATSLGSFNISSHPTRNCWDAGSTKQTKNQHTNPNTIPLTSGNKYQQLSHKQYFTPSQSQAKH